MKEGRIICFGEMLLRLATPRGARLRRALPGSVQASFAGAEANVAVALAQLGLPASFIGALPENELGVAALEALRGAGVDVDCIVQLPRARLGIFFLEQGADPRPARVIYDRVGSAAALARADQFPFERALEGAAWVHVSGITSAISEQGHAANVRLVREARRRGLPVSMDLNLRSQLWLWGGAESPVALMRRCLRELSGMVTHLWASDGQVAEVYELPLDGGLEGSERLQAARGLMGEVARRFQQLERIGFSHRETLGAGHVRIGALLYDCATRQCACAPVDREGAAAPHDIAQVTDRVGTGDAFAAGLIYAHLVMAEEGLSQGAAFAAACGALAHSIEGDFSWISAAEVRECMAAGNARGIQR